MPSLVVPRRINIGGAVEHVGTIDVGGDWRQRRRLVQRSTEDEGALKLEFDNRWEGPGDAFQTIVEGIEGLEVRVTPADDSSSFDALLVGGYGEYEDSHVDNAALVQVQRVDDHGDPVGEPEYIRVKALRISS